MKAALTPVVLAVLLGLTACGGGGGSPTQAVTNGPIGRGAKRVWVFRPAGKPKRLVIFFHGQGGPVELTPANHRPWIDHLVARGAAVIYPQYETAAEAGVMGQAVAGIRSATKALGLESVPVVALGYSRGGALAIEYAAVAPARHVPVPKVVESVNPVAFGEEADVVNLKTLRPRTVLAVLVSDKDPAAAESTGLLFKRLQEAGFPETQIKTRVARSHGTFTADHLAPLGTSPAARAAYWVPTDSLLSSLASG